MLVKIIDKKSSGDILGSCGNPITPEDHPNDKQFFGFLRVDLRNCG